MNLSKLKQQVLFTTLTLLSPCTLLAAEIPLTGPMPFSSMDKNNDKTISPDEYVTAYNQRKKMQSKAGLSHSMNNPAFLFFDANGDNKITELELNDGRIRMRQQNSGTARAVGQNQRINSSNNMPKFSEFDLNNDGVLHKEECYEARKKRMYLRADEGFPMKNAASAPAFEEVDLNTDGKVTQKEFAAYHARQK